MAGVTAPANDSEKLVTVLTDLVKSGEIPIAHFIGAYNELRSVEEATPLFAVLDFQHGGDTAAVPAALRLAIKDGFFIALTSTLLARKAQPLIDDDERTKTLTSGIESLGAVGTMQRMLRLVGLRSVNTLPAIQDTARATALIKLKLPGRGETAVGTGFLVAPSLLLTAAHVVEPLIENEQERPGSAEQASVFFYNRLQAPGEWPYHARFASKWLVAMSPPNGTNGRIALANPAAAATQLDFALIRLAEPVGAAVGVVNVADPPEPQVNGRLTVIGYEGGSECGFDDHLVSAHDADAGRIRHDVNTQSGMSGGPCIDSDGRAVGLHEGSVTQVHPEYNRAIHLGAVRRLMKRGGLDPLTADTGPLLGVYDASARRAWIAAGEALLGTSDAHRTEWLDSVAPFNPDDPRLGNSAEIFHPIFGRRDLQDWITQGSLQNATGRIALLSGQPGAGKSFSAAILRQMLKGGQHVMVLVPPAIAKQPVTGAIEFILKEAGGQPATSADPVLRPAAGVFRRDVLPSAFNQLSAIVRGASRPSALLWLVVDVAEDVALTADVAAEWKQFLIEAEAQSWVRLLMVGLSPTRRGEFRTAMAAPGKVFAQSLPMITSDEFLESIRAQAEALRLPPDDWSRFSSPLFDEFVDPLALAQGRSVHAVRLALEVRAQMLTQARGAGAVGG